MMDELVERLRSREGMATPGPWQMQDGNSHRRVGTPGSDGNVIRPARYSEREPNVLTLDGDSIYADLMLAVEARNALPSLLDRIESLTAQLAKAHRKGFEEGREAAAKEAEREGELLDAAYLDADSDEARDRIAARWRTSLRIAETIRSLQPGDGVP